MYCKKKFPAVNQNETWMRHGYSTAMGHGTPITILKRGLAGTSQIDSQVRNHFLHTLSVILNFIY